MEIFMDKGRLNGEKRKLRIVVAATLVLMTFQGWLGDSINLFGKFPATVTASAGGFVSAILSVGPFLIVHVASALLLAVLGVITAAIAFRTGPRGAKIASIIGLLFIASAIIGGTLFVMSGFADNGYSAQMGASFIFAYASYFLVLYYTKG